MRDLLTSHIRAVGAALVLVLFVAACDSGGDTTDSDIVGAYEFTTFVFEPEAALVEPANVLDTLVAGATTMRFFSNERFTLEYQLEGTNEVQLIEGTYEIDGNRVELDIRDAFDDEREQLLLPDEFTLDVINDGQRLEADIGRTGIDLSDFSPDYAGVEEVSGELVLRLVRR